MNPGILKLYLVLDPDLCGGAEGMVATAKAAAAAGATAVQLRAPSWKKRAFAECGRELLSVLSPYGVPLFVNDHADVAVAIGAQGVHVGQKDLSPADCRKIMPAGMLLGLSVSNVGEAKALDPALVDYAGAGPVFATSTKPDAAPAFGFTGANALASVIAASPVPVVAIGGIKAEHIPEILQAGAAGAAVVSAVCGRPDPAAAVRDLLARY